VTPQEMGRPPLPPSATVALEARRLEAVPSDLATVVGYWRKALTKADDVAKQRAAGVSLDTQVEAAYTGLLQASLAVLASHGLRPKGEAHHHTALVVAADLIGRDRGRLDVALDATRPIRRHAQYAPEPATPDDVRSVLRALDLLLPAAATHLQARHPGHAAALRAPAERLA
jgi:hypothetical protein